LDHHAINQKKGYCLPMEADRSSRIAELKRQISLLKKDELRLHWIVRSQFISEELRAMAHRDCYSVLDNLRKAEIELSRLEIDKPVNPN
jgi:hypothetical protein